jgi:endonuclease/exonuclease/phosphatase family metal-dependent hydrolase
MLFSKQRGRDLRDSAAPAKRRSLALPAQNADPGALRIATYNIHKGVSALSWRNRIHELRESLHGLDADLVFLQEVQGKSDKHAQRFANWPEAAQHDFLASSVWEHAVYGRNAERVDGHHGNALLSRYPLLTSENLDVSDHRFESRGLLHCEIDVKGRIVHCLCAHFGLFEDGRKRQADALIRRIRATVPDDARNTGAMLPPALANMLAIHRQRAANAPGRTYPALFPVFRLDRMYLRGFKVREAIVVSGAGWRKLSDHAPIVADLNIV